MVSLTSPQVRPHGSSDAIALSIQIASDLHGVAGQTLVGVFILRRLGQEGVFSVLGSHCLHAFVGRLDKHPGICGRHEGPHALVCGHRRLLWWLAGASIGSGKNCAITDVMDDRITSGMASKMTGRMNNARSIKTATEMTAEDGHDKSLSYQSNFYLEILNL